MAQPLDAEMTSVRELYQSPATIISIDKKDVHGSLAAATGDDEKSTIDVSHDSSDDTTKVLTLPWTELEQSALRTLRERFGDLHPLLLAKTMLKLGPIPGRHHCSCRRCRKSWIEHGRVEWTCFQILYPELSYNLIEIAEWMNKVLTQLDLDTIKETFLSLKGQPYDDPMRWRVKNINPFMDDWEPRRSSLMSLLGQIQGLWRSAEPGFARVDPIFAPFEKDVTECIEGWISKSIIAEMELQEKQALLEESKKDRTNGSPSSTRDDGLGFDVEAQKQYAQRNMSRTTNSREFRMSIYRARQKLNSNLGDIRIMSVIMAVLCCAGLGANVVAVCQWTASGDPTPVIDSNFWSTLAQSNIGIAAIYSVVIPELQTGKSPVQDEWRWLFKTFLWFSILTALMATIVYPWHGRTSIVAGFVSCFTQLSVTLQMILSAGKQIKNLEERIVVLNEDMSRR